MEYKSEIVMDYMQSIMENAEQVNRFTNQVEQYRQNPKRLRDLDDENIELFMESIIEVLTAQHESLRTIATTTIDILDEMVK